MKSDPDQTNQPTAAPTVIVARRVRAGSENAFAQWHDQIQAAARAYPGYVDSELQPPDTAHPDEWVTVYSFATASQLEAWLASARREELSLEAVPLLDGPVREQRIAALRTAPEPVTVVFSQLITPANHEAFLASYEEVARRLEASDGFLGSNIFPPVAGVQEEYVIVASFASRPDLDAWLNSDNRRAWLDDVAGFIEGSRTMNVVGGFGGWFPAAPRGTKGPKKWKQGAVVLLALYPTALIITLLRIELAPDMNVVLAVLVGNVLGVAALTFFLMPALTRRLASWLAS